MHGRACGGEKLRLRRSVRFWLSLLAGIQGAAPCRRAYLYLGSTPPDPETDTYASADARGDEAHGTHAENGIDPAIMYD